MYPVVRRHCMCLMMWWPWAPAHQRMVLVMQLCCTVHAYGYRVYWTKETLPGSYAFCCAAL